MVQLNPPLGNQSTILNAIMYIMAKVSQGTETGLVDALRYARGQQAELETDANQ